MSRSTQVLKFLRALLKHGKAKTIEPKGCVSVIGAPAISLNVREIKSLESRGLLKRHNGIVTATGETRNWVRRQVAQYGDPYSAQHQKLVLNEKEGRLENMSESPLARLNTGQKGFLCAHHRVAAERFSVLFEKAALQKRTTMSYDPTRVASPKKIDRQADHLSTTAYEARCQIETMLEGLTSDCAAVVLDVCGFEKGLQLVERERGWPRRSAKIVLRIGLEQLATQLGLTSNTVGKSRKGLSIWRPEGARPMALGLKD